MKILHQTKDQIIALIQYAQANKESLYIVSGESEQGTAEKYTGAMTVREIMARLRKERCGGDRWARVDTSDGCVLMGVM